MDAKKYFTLIFLIISIFTVKACAHTLAFKVLDYNTRSPVSNATITICSHICSDIVTNSNGLAYYNNISMEHYYNISRPEYFSTYDNLLNITNDTLETVRLYPISTDGLVKIRITDLTGQNRKYCVFYSSQDFNGRLEGCYSQNETVLLTVNNQYSIRPILTPSDALTSSNNAVKIGNYALSGIWTFIVLLGFIFIILAMGYAMIKRR